MKRTFMKKISLLLTFLLVISLCACGGGGTGGEAPSTTNTAAASGEKIVIKFGHNYALDHPAEIVAQQMKKDLEEKSGGRIILETYPSQQLGASRELMTGIINNTVEMCLTSTFGTIEPKILATEMPYMFSSYEHVRAFQNSSIDDELLSGLDSQKVKALGFWPVGFRMIGNSKREVKTPDDLNGLIIRAFENQMLTETLTALGANVTVMPAGEVYVALQTGTIDGEENPYVNTYTMKFYEVAKYKTETRHLFNWDIIALSKTFWDGLSAEDQAIISEVVNDGTAQYTDLVEEGESSYKQLLIDVGVTITEIDDYTPWIDAVQPIYEKWEPEFGKELIDSIRNLA